MVIFTCVCTCVSVYARKFLETLGMRVYADIVLVVRPLIPSILVITSFLKEM